MTLPLAIAEKLKLLADGGQLPASRLKHDFVDEMTAEGIISKRFAGRTKVTLSVNDQDAFHNYLYHKWSIISLTDYIATLKNPGASRASLVQVTANSKSKPGRTFKGFLVNSYMPISALLSGEQITICPPQGTFQFIYDFETFVPGPGVTIVGVENAENFAAACRQRYLFPGLETLFVSRYPQGQDLITWLRSVPNQYLHLGDYDFACINIYHQEYKKHLGERAAFFIPDDIEALLEKYGNRSLYDQQQLNHYDITEPGLTGLIALIHKYKKGLEQEALLIAQTDL